MIFIDYMSQNQPSVLSRVFILAGRTGGPLTPLLAVSKNLSEVEIILLGVRGGVEEKFAEKMGYRLMFLPETKLRLLSFKQAKFRETLSHVWDFFQNIFKFIWALIVSFWLLWRYRPKLILSAGSFLTVPVFWAAFIFKKLMILDVQLVMHQQDPEPGLSNKLTVKLADKLTCVFAQTKQHKDFSQAQIIPNPLDTEAFDQASVDLIESADLQHFIRTAKLPKLLIFGGGTGSQIINRWVTDNLAKLTSKFSVIHFTGLLKVNHTEERRAVNYLATQGSLTDMPSILKSVDLVLCRSGLGSITELSYLAKPAYLVPIKHSHQEPNAECVKDRFYILDEDKIDTWFNTISRTYPQFFQKLHRLSPDQIKIGLRNYYNQLNQLLDKKS